MGEFVVRGDAVVSAADQVTAISESLAANRIVGAEVGAPVLQTAVDELLSIAGSAVDGVIADLHLAARGAILTVETMRWCDMKLAALAREDGP